MTSASILPQGSQNDNDTSEVQKHLQLHDMSMGEYVTDKYKLCMAQLQDN